MIFVGGLNHYYDIESRDRADMKLPYAQDELIGELLKIRPDTIVVMVAGSPVEMPWVEQAKALVWCYYSGMETGTALAEILLGQTNPSAKLPVTVPKSAGQLPLNYSFKPSGRGYSYCDNDGKPLFPFGYGLSYTSFAVENIRAELTADGVNISFDILNTGAYDGAEVIQVYLSSCNCEVVRPVKELKAYKKIELKAGEKKTETISLDAEAFYYWNLSMDYGLHNGKHCLLIGNSSEKIFSSVEITAENGKLYL